MISVSTRNARGAVPLVMAGIVALGVVPAVTPGLAATAKSVVAQATLLDTESWIMGGSGLPIPPPSYLAALTDRFLDPATPKFAGQPTFPVDVTNGLFTPEGLYPLTGVKSLPLDTSLDPSRRGRSDRRMSTPVVLSSGSTASVVPSPTSSSRAWPTR